MDHRMNSISTAAESSREGQQEKPQRGEGPLTDDEIKGFFDTFDQVSRMVDFYRVKIDSMVRNIDDMVKDYPAAAVAATSPLELFRFNVAILKMIRDVNEVKMENEALRVDADAMVAAINVHVNNMKAQKAMARSEADK